MPNNNMPLNSHPSLPQMVQRNTRLSPKKTSPLAKPSEDSDDITIVYTSPKKACTIHHKPVPNKPSSTSKMTEDQITETCKGLIALYNDDSSLGQAIINLGDAKVVDEVIKMLTAIPSCVRVNLDSTQTICKNLIKKINEHYLNGQGIDGNTPLHTAILDRNSERARDLFYHGEKLDIQNNNNCQDRDGNTPLHTAILDMDSELAIYLFYHGAKLDIQNNNNYTPLELATKSSISFADYLIGLAMCPLKEEEVKRYKEKHLSTRIEECKHLLDPLDKINDLTIEGGTRLHAAVKTNLPYLAFLAIKYGANPNIKNAEGKTTIELVESIGSKHMKDFFEKNLNFATQYPNGAPLEVPEIAEEDGSNSMGLSGEG